MGDVLADTNILVRVVSPHDVQHGLVLGAVEILIANGWRIRYTPQSLREFWNVMTRPASVNGKGVSVRTADEGATLLERRFALLHDTDGMHALWRSLVVQHEVRGVQVHDARIAASALIGGCRAILTLNDPDFRRYGMAPLHPRDVSSFVANEPSQPS